MWHFFLNQSVRISLSSNVPKFRSNNFSVDLIFSLDQMFGRIFQSAYEQLSVLIIFWYDLYFFLSNFCLENFCFLCCLFQGPLLLRLLDWTSNFHIFHIFLFPVCVFFNFNFWKISLSKLYWLNKCHIFK